MNRWSGRDEIFAHFIDDGNGRRGSADSRHDHDVKLVRLLVGVKNQAGDLIGSLDREAFEVYDCGVKQEIAVFERQTVQPLSVSVLVG